MVKKELFLSTPQKLITLFPVVGIFLLFFLANPSVISDLRSYSFDDGTYSHTYLLPFVIAFLYWRAWKQQQLVLEWRPLFFLLFIGCLVFFLLLQLAQQNILSRLLLPLVVIFALLSLYRANSSVIVPASLLWFITPIWGAINGLLQDISVVAVSEIMRWTSIPTFVEGNFVYIPSGTFEIADGCSGLRYFIVSLALSVIFSFLNLKRVRSVLFFFSIAILGSLITNWIRIVLLIMIGHQTEMQSSLMEDHNTFGWYLYVPFIALLFYFGSFLDRDKALTPAAEPAAKTPFKPIYIVSVFLPLLIVSTLTVNVITPGTPIYPIAAIDVTAEPQSRAFTTISPRLFAVDEFHQRLHREGEHDVWMQHFIFYGFEDSRRSNYYLNHMVPEDWSQQSFESTGDAAWIRVRSPSGEYGLVYYWHQIGKHKTVSGLKMRVYRLLQALKLNQQTELYWYFMYCQSDVCSAEQEILLQASKS